MSIDPYIDMIEAQFMLLDNQQTQVTMRLNGMTGAVQLVRALGGGWDVTDPSAPSNITTKETASRVSDNQ